MLVDVIHAEPLDEYKVFLRFSDGAGGSVDIARLVDWTGVFAPVKDLDYFRMLRLDPELGTIVWPNHADVDPIVLWSAATGKRLPLPGTTPTTTSESR